MKLKKILNFMIIVLTGISISACNLNSGNYQTVNMPKTNLSWTRCSYGQEMDKQCSGKAVQLSWKDADSYCKSLTLNDRKWKLPSSNELLTILPDELEKNGVSLTAFPGTENNYYWTQSDDKENPGRHWTVNFPGGNENLYPDDYQEFVRCVSELK